MRKAVDLPQPDGPNSVTKEPPSTLNDVGNSAVTGPLLAA
jgi:hypothetical protein